MCHEHMHTVGFRFPRSCARRRSNDEGVVNTERRIECRDASCVAIGYVCRQVALIDLLCWDVGGLGAGGGEGGG